MSSLSLVMFDCDGVLIDSEILAARVEAEMLRDYGCELSPEELAHRFAGLTWARIMELLTAETGITFPDDLKDRVGAEFDRRAPKELVAIEGVNEMLDALELPRCICSNSSSAQLKFMLSHVGLWDRFRPYVYPSREVGEGHPKPAPDVYLHGCAEFGVRPRQAIVLEDSVHGVAAAVAAGCRVVGFTGASHSYPGHGEALSDAGAETVIARLRDFPAVVEAFSSWSGD
ncbi:haloacid dehalogenase [Aureimonas endophytica]|uniref:Haloacid dehalogenase n=1 Tax=Aureimonas endophytica TaxID=2027858 RepID=A0A917E8E0_9HYPH|nr:HAD family phosphatase [Aureimonas endophytica]GGE14239.1 haloacid dehalogenase [Aureimonas endophytica]